MQNTKILSLYQGFINVYICGKNYKILRFRSGYMNKHVFTNLRLLYYFDMLWGECHSLSQVNRRVKIYILITLGRAFLFYKVKHEG